MRRHHIRVYASIRYFQLQSMTSVASAMAIGGDACGNSTRRRFICSSDFLDQVSGDRARGNHRQAIRGINIKL
ncbi:hypothetical protein [Sediminibacillus albus]|uniref:hypothetical protein n=1 Tax=Sediminibacillus albus TaxID=407036 RepID=UPI0015880330|nr:hypothetical protein [Sediminibacillus albus]